jgi:Ser/Thr protein kinase RdoA (MazF antagonist)
MLDEVAATRCPSWAPAADEIELFSGWSDIALDPAPFLTLGLSTHAWLDAALPALIRSERPPEIAGDRLLHFDVRSDNICFTADRTLLVDWNWIARGNPLLDVAAWLPSLATEGGLLPEEVEPGAAVFAPALAGYFCSHAPLPVIADAPHVRDAQLEQALTSLPWAARWLGLPPPDGPRFARIS